MKGLDVRLSPTSNLNPNVRVSLTSNLDMSLFEVGDTRTSVWLNLKLFPRQINTQSQIFRSKFSIHLLRLLLWICINQYL